MINEKSIRDAYARIRTIDQTIPDDVLDFMKDASINQLKIKPSISGLYYRYKSASNDTIRDVLKTVKVVRKQNKGVDTIFGYYPLTDKVIEKISKKPRELSLTFNATETSDECITGLRHKKTITFLVKSTSRFFLKPDIGEVIDQIETEDLFDADLKAICLNDGYETLDETEGEHFLMTAMLLH
ncbi:MAG: hypothetical protein IPJ01_10080 [Micavibrio sp.]|nr:hypothetical protein [Micavibrio sp.]